MAISLAAGNSTIWKPSPTTPLCAIAVTKIISDVLERNGIPGAVASLIVGGNETGRQLVESSDIDLGKVDHLFVVKHRASRLWQFRSPEAKLSVVW